MHSFDRARERPAPLELTGVTLEGAPWSRPLRRITLVVAVKPDCDGCTDFVAGDIGDLSHLDVVVVSSHTNDQWRAQHRAVLVAPALLEQLQISSAPFYVLIDALRGRVVGEGSVFSPAQVAQEIAPFFAP